MLERIVGLTLAATVAVSVPLTWWSGEAMPDSRPASSPVAGVVAPAPGGSDAAGFGTAVSRPPAAADVPAPRRTAGSGDSGDSGAAALPPLPPVPSGVLGAPLGGGTSSAASSATDPATTVPSSDWARVGDADSPQELTTDSGSSPAGPGDPGAIPTGSPTGTPAPSGLPAGRLRLADANINTRLSTQDFTADLAKATASEADVITLNEVSRRTPAQLRPQGYDAVRPTGRRIANAVLWRTDRWTATARGHRVIVTDGPQRNDAGRTAVYATLRSRSDDRVVSVVSVHHMQNPWRIGPDKPRRQELYRIGMERLRSLVDELSAQGPVFVAGDFNSPHRSTEAASPRRMLAGSGLRSVMEVLGVQPTHDAGGVIDFVFFPHRYATASAQRVESLRSDHRLMVADFTLRRS